MTNGMTNGASPKNGVDSSRLKAHWPTVFE